MKTSRSLASGERTSARAIQKAMRPKLNPQAFATAITASLQAHGEDRHNIVKWHAMHARPEQIA